MKVDGHWIKERDAGMDKNWIGVKIRKKKKIDDREWEKVKVEKWYKTEYAKRHFELEIKKQILGNWKAITLVDRDSIYISAQNKTGRQIYILITKGN